MEIELGLKITHTRDDATSSTEFWFAKDHTGLLFFSRETATMFILIAYLRGFKRENIEIKISEDGKKLTIGGKRPVQEITLRGWIMHKTDVEIREFRKVFLIPHGVNVNRIKAKFNNEESTLRITMPKFVKGICGIEIQEVREEHKDRPEAAPPVDDLAHEIEQREPKIQRAEDADQVEHREYRCEPKILEGMVDQSLLKDRESLEEGMEPRIERKEKIDNVEEKAVDALQFKKDSQVEQGEVSGCEPMTPAMVDKSSQKDGKSMEEVEASTVKKKEETDHVVDQPFDAFQGDKQNHLEQDEFQGDKQERVEQAFDEFQSDKQDQDQRDVNRGEPEAPPVIIDETSQQGGKSLDEDAESVMESKMDEMVEPQHDEVDQVQQREISRRELEIPQAMIDETTQKEVKSLEEDAESMMPSKVDQPVEKQRHDKADQVQPEEVSRYEPEISEGMVDLSSLKGGESLEEDEESRIERKEKIDDVVEKAVGMLQFEKDNQVEQGEISGREPLTPATVDKSSQKDGTLTEEAEAPMMRKKVKMDHVVDQAFDEFQSNKQNHLEQDEFQGDKQDQVEQAFDESQSDKQDQLDQRGITRGEPEAPPVITDETSQKGGIPQKEGTESVMENKMNQMVEQRHDQADQVQQREVSRHEPEIPQAMIDEATQKEDKSVKEDVESMMPSKEDQIVDKPQHDKGDKMQLSEVSRYEPELPQVIVDETLEKDIGESQPDKVDHSEQPKVSRYGPEIPQVMVDETLQKKEKTQEDSAEAMAEGEEGKMDQVIEQVVDERRSDEVDHVEKREVSRLESEMPPVAVDQTSLEDGKSLEEGAEAMTKSKDKISQVAEQVFDEAQRDKTDREKQRAVSKCEPQMQIDYTSKKDDKLPEGAESVMEFVEQVVDEPRSSTDEANQVEKWEFSRFQPEISDAIIDEASQKDGKSLEEEEGTESMMKSKEKIDQVAAKAIEHDKAEFVDEVCPEIESRKLIPQKKSKKPKTEEKERGPEMAVEEKRDQEPMETQSANEMVPRTIASSELGEARTEKAESPTYPKILAPEIGPLKTDHEVKKTVDDALPRKDKTFEESEKAKIERHRVHDSNELQLNEVERTADVSPEMGASKLVPEAIHEKPKTEVKEETVKAGEEKHGQADLKEMEDMTKLVPQDVVPKELEDFTQKKGYPEITMEFHKEKEVSKWEPEEARKAADDEPKKDEELVEEAAKSKISSEEEVLVAEISSETDDKEMMQGREPEKQKLETKKVTEKAAEEKLDGGESEEVPQITKFMDLEEAIPEKKEPTSASVAVPQSEFKEMEEPTQLVPQSTVSMQEVKIVPEGDKHPVSSASCPETEIPHVETPKTRHVEKKDVSKWEPEVKKFLVDEHLEKDRESIDETKTEDKKDIYEVEHQRQLIGADTAAKISGEMDGSGLVIEEELGKPKLEMKTETEKAVEEKLDEEGPEGVDMMPQTIASLQQEEDISKKTELPSTSALHPKMTSDSDTSKFQYDGEKEATKQEPEAAKHAVEEVPKKEEETIQEIVKPKIKIEEESDQAMQHVMEEVPKKEDMFREIAKPKIDSEEERDHVVRQVADELSFGVQEVPKVFPFMDNSKMVPEEKFERPDIGIKEDVEKAMKEKVNGGGESKELQDLSQLVPETPAEEEPPFRKITETFGVELQKEIEEPQVKEPIADQKSQTEELLKLQEHEMQVTSAERSLLEEESKPPKGVDLADVTDKVTQQPEEPYVTETQADQAYIASKPMKDLTLPESEKQEQETSVEGIMRPKPEKGKVQVEAPVLKGEPQKDVSRGYDEDHGVVDEYTSEKQEAIIELPMKPVMRPKPEKGKVQVEAPVLKGEPQKDVSRGYDEDHGVVDEYTSEKQEAIIELPMEPDKGKEQIETPHHIAKLQEDGDYQQDEDNGTEAEKLPPGTSVQGTVKPKTAREKEQVKAPIPPHEPPQDDDHAQDEDHRKRKETPPEKWEPGLSFEGLMKPLPDQERKHVETPLLDDEQKSIRDHILDDDHGLEKEIESKKKKPEISFEEPTKHDLDQEKEQVETSVLTDELPRDVDRGQESETTLEKREPGMCFEGQMKPVPDKERVQVETALLADELKNGRGRGQGKEPELNIEGRMTPEPDQKIQQFETPIRVDEAKKNGDSGENEVYGLQREIDSGKIEPQVIVEGPIKPETDNEKEQVKTPLLADKEEKAAVHELGREIEELNDEFKLPEKKETEDHELLETEIQKDFRIEQTTRKMDIVPIKCKLRSLLFFAGSTFLLPLIVIVMKKSLIKFKSKKR